jgi:hypothetical protein
MPKERDFKIFANATLDSIQKRGYEPAGLPVLVDDDLLHYTEKFIEKTARALLAKDGEHKEYDGAALFFKSSTEKNAVKNPPESADILYTDGEPVEGDLNIHYTIVLGLKKTESEN